MNDEPRLEPNTYDTIKHAIDQLKRTPRPRFLMFIPLARLERIARGISYLKENVERFPKLRLKELNELEPVIELLIKNRRVIPPDDFITNPYDPVHGPPLEWPLK